MKYHFLSILLFAAISLNGQCNRFSDSLVLVMMYDSLDGENWKKTWDLEASIDTWHGIRLNDDGCVVFIDLNGVADFVNGPLNKGSGTGNNMTGTMPILNLEALESLYLYDKIGGDVSAFQHLKNIKYLAFQNRDGDSKIVGQISMLPNKENLIYLNGGANFLIGDLSDFINQTPNLEYAYLRANPLSGELEDYQNNSKLIVLNCVNCNLIGDIPNFSGLNSLVELHLGSNNLSGPIPNFNNLTNLESLDLTSNNFSGELPSFEYLKEIKHLNVGFNNIEGMCPTFSENNKLEVLGLGGNNLEGSIPNYDIASLERLFLNDNDLNGEIPIFNLPNLKFLSLNNNSLDGFIPDFDLPELTDLRISGNKLEGPISGLNLPKLTTLVINGNKFSYIENLDYTPLLNFLDIRDNQFTFTSILNSIWVNIYQYQPQKNIPVSPVFSEDSIVLNVDKEVDGNTFYWFKNGVVFDTTMSSQVKLNEMFDDSDDFHIQWTNESVSNLELTSEIFTQMDSYVSVNGLIYNDENENCVYDMGETLFQNESIILEHDSGLKTYLVTNANGYFDVILQPGGYIISQNANGLWNNCIEGFSVDGESSELNINIGKVAFNQCEELSVVTNIERSFLRRCFNNKIGISYCNNGTLEVEDAYILFNLDQEILVDSFSVEGVIDQSGGVYKIDIGSLVIGECGSFIAYVTTSCDANLGTTQCIEAKIFPNEICNALGSIWSGPTIDVKGNCNSGEVEFIIKNLGGADMVDPVNYKIIENDLIIQTGQVELDQGEEFEIVLAGNGKTYRLEVDQVEDHPCSLLPSVTIEGCSEMGQVSISTSYVNQFPQADACPFSDIECYSVIGSFDPNDLLANPLGYGEEHYIENNTEIEFRIRFQNIGNDTAFNIYITDPLPLEFDTESIRDLRFSHTMRMEILNNILSFEFPNIQLVDSLTHEEGSHGWVSFKITPKQDLQIGTTLENQASIVFDFNDPIYTNTVFHTIGQDFVPTSTNDVITSEVQVIPNPSRDLVQIICEKYVLNSYTVVNGHGQILLKGNENIINVSHLQAGVYILIVDFGASGKSFKRIVKI